MRVTIIALVHHQNMRKLEDVAVVKVDIDVQSVRKV